MTNIRFAKLLVAINCAVPLALLGWDSYKGNLGANPVNSAILTTGMMTLILLCLTLLITPLRQLSGLNWLISFRRTLGVWAFFYACVHFLIYFIKDQSASITGASFDILHSNYLIYGFVGLVLMTPLALTSTNSMIKRLGPKRWQPLHRLIYIVVIAGIVHYCQQTKTILPLQKGFIVVIVMLLGYRLAQKLRTMIEGDPKAKRQRV